MQDRTAAPGTKGGIEIIPGKAEKDMDPKEAALLIELTKAALTGTLAYLGCSGTLTAAEAAVMAAKEAIELLREEGAL